MKNTTGKTYLYYYEKKCFCDILHIIVIYYVELVSTILKVNNIIFLRDKLKQYDSNI